MHAAQGQASTAVAVRKLCAASGTQLAPDGGLANIGRRTRCVYATQRNAIHFAKSLWHKDLRRSRFVASLCNATQAIRQGSAPGEGRLFHAWTTAVG
jgi:hypothetical protein